MMATMGLDIGGAETHIVELAKELKHRGHDVLIVSNGGVYVREVEGAGIRHCQAPLNQILSTPTPESRPFYAVSCAAGTSLPLSPPATEYIR